MADAPWFALAVDYWRNPKVARAGFLAASLNLAALAYCAEQLTDGFVPRSVVPMLAAPMHDLAPSDPLALASALVDVGLWIEAPGGWQVNDYLKHQRSREEVEEKREQARNAGKQGGLKRAANRVAKQTASETLSEASSGTPSGSQAHAPTPTQLPRTSGKPAAPPRLDVEQVCAAVVAAEVAKGSKQPTITETWRTQARLMLDADNRPLPETLAIIAWARDHKFWRANIRSVPKLREQYDTLRLQKAGEKNYDAQGRECPPGQEALPTYERFRQVTL